MLLTTCGRQFVRTGYNLYNTDVSLIVHKALNHFLCDYLHMIANVLKNRLLHSFHNLCLKAAVIVCVLALGFEGELLWQLGCFLELDGEPKVLADQLAQRFVLELVQLRRLVRVQQLKADRVAQLALDDAPRINYWRVVFARLNQIVH